MKKLFFVFVLALSFSVTLNAQNSSPPASNNAFTLCDSTYIGRLKKFNLSSPGNLISINSGDNCNKLTLEFGAPGYLYFITWPSSFFNYLYRIDTANGTVTQISTAPYVVGSGSPGFGMTWDRTNNTMYVLYGGGITKVNVYTGVFTHIATLTPPTLAGVHAFAVNNSGSMFGIMASKLVRINKDNGIVTPVDTFKLSGYNVSGCDFDPITNNMYILYPNGSNSSVYKVDTANGNTTLIGSIAASVKCLAFAGNTFVGINHIGTEIPSEFKLMQNYPNPFNPVTKIKFNIAESGFVRLSVYDMLGREVSVLVNEKLSPGNYDVDWNAAEYPSGAYFYRMSTEKFTETKTMLLVK